MLKERANNPTTPHIPYWKIAQRAGIIEDKGKILPTDSVPEADRKRAVMTAIVIRLKKRAEATIDNVSNGRFI
jgi:hypothetical protein